ncbi:MAG: flippase [Draconibacterium sp.]
MNQNKNQINAEDSAQKIKTGFLASAGNIVSRIFSFLSGLIVARAIGPNNYGLFVLCRNLCQTGCIFSKSGFDLSLIRKIRENKDNALLQSSYITSALYITGAISFSLVLLTWLWGSRYLATNAYHYDQFIPVLNVMILLVPIFAVFQIFIGLNRAYFSVKQSIIAENLLQPSSRLLLIIILFFFCSDLWAVILGTLLSYLLVSCYLIEETRKQITIHYFPPKQLPKINISSFWRYSFMIAITNSVGLLLTKMDSFMIGYFNGPEDIGKYAIVQLTVPVIVIFNSSFNKLLGPTIAEFAAENNHQGMAASIKQHGRWMAIGSFPLFLIFAAFGKDLLLVFGKDFSLPTATITILAGGQLVTALFSSSGFLLSLTNKYKFEFPILLTALLQNIILNYLLIPKFGIIGAAGATLASLFTANIIRLTIISKIYNFFIFDRWFFPPILVASLSITLIIYIRFLLQDSTIAGAYIFSAIYLITYLLLLNFIGLNQEDKEISKRITTYFRKKFTTRFTKA